MEIAWHLALLYVPAAIAVGLAVATRRRRGDPPTAQREYMWTLIPFTAGAVVDSLLLKPSPLAAQWLVPLAAALVVTACSRSPDVIRSARAALFFVAAFAWGHGLSLLDSGYTTRKGGLFPGARVESAWYTPLTGFRKVVHTGDTD
jgi:hypothetical protein